MAGAELKLRVRELRLEAEDVLSIALVDPEGRRVPDWAPGAHIEVHLRPGLTRQYSLCSDPADTRSYRVAVLREPAGRGGSAYVHDQLRPGDTVGVAGPRNNFELLPADRYLFIAGGIGVTPLLPMVRELAARDSDWSMLYGGRRGASMAFRAELEQHGPRVEFRPENKYGLLDIDGFLGEPATGTRVYCCGPEGLLRAVEGHCGDWPSGALQVERFHPRPIPAAERNEEHAFLVECRQSGIEVTVTPGVSILDALRDAGLDPPHSCEEGVCGTCETPLLEGRADHRDSILSDEERATHDTIFICCSRAEGERLVLDC